MVLFDGIIYSLQKMGGISTLFNEIIIRMPRDCCEVIGYEEALPLSKSINYYYQCPRFLERYRRLITTHKPDIFHSTYYRQPAEKKCKVVTTVHDYTYERYSSGLRRIAHSIQKNNAIASSDTIICVSESTRRDLLEFSGISSFERSVVIHNGVSSDYYNITGTEILSQVLFVGERAGYKNFESVVLALSGINDINLVCVGGGAFTRKEIYLLEKYVHGRYLHTGYLSNTDLNLEYNRALCLIYPSLYEGFGIPIIEAMRAGCPVIAINGSAIPEVVGDSALLLNCGHPDEIRHALNTLFIRQTRDKFVSKGLSRSKMFSWDKTFKETLAVYENLLGKRLTE